MNRDNQQVVITNLIINGRWLPSATNRTYDLYNPARPDELVGRAAKASVEDVDGACKAADDAFPAWSGLSYQERAAYLRKVDEILVADKEELAQRIRLFTREHGKILKEAETEMTRLGSRFQISASFADRLAKDDELHSPPFDTIITRQPRGVALLIVPWNWPLSILGAKLPQALIAGNTVVIKPSNFSALAPALTIKKMAEILPPGVINMVTGSSAEIGDPLLTHPLVRKINFTGGVEVGKHVMAKAAERLTPVTLELGGNDAGLVLEDAELDDATVRRMVIGTFMSTGQVCMALKRLYVHESRYDELVEKFMAVASQYVVGDGLDPSVTMGPLNNKAQQQFVKSLVAQARERRAEVRELGKIADEETFKKGYFHRPTVVLDADPELRVVKEEQFGPVLPILTFKDDAQAIRLANDSQFGLCSSVWTRDKERALKIARRLEAGYTYVTQQSVI